VPGPSPDHRPPAACSRPVPRRPALQPPSSPPQPRPVGARAVRAPSHSRTASRQPNPPPRSPRRPDPRIQTRSMTTDRLAPHEHPADRGQQRPVGHSSLGRGTWRRSTASWWRRTRSSRSLVASPRASSTSSWMERHHPNVGESRQHQGASAVGWLKRHAAEPRRRELAAHRLRPSLRTLHARPGWQVAAYELAVVAGQGFSMAAVGLSAAICLQILRGGPRPRHLGCR
jgi:hypothetical protein